MSLMQRLSCCTFPLQEMEVGAAFAAIAAAGFAKVDVLGRPPHLDLSDPSSTANAAARSSLAVANLGTYSGKGFAAEPAEQKEAFVELCKALDTAQAMGARSIRVSAGDDTAACIEQIVPWFKRGAVHAAAVGVYMGFENHGGEISGSPARCLELCEAVGSTFFGVLYDPCNLMAEGTDYRHALATFGTRIVHVHFKDGLTRDGEWQRCGLGDGEIDFRWIISQLQSLGYDGDYALEFELKPEGGDNKAMATLALEPTAGLAHWLKSYEALVARL